MKVLVHFEQEFYTKSGDIIELRNTQTLTKMFNASSNANLLAQFDNYNFVPHYIKKIGRLKDIFQCGRKKMIWYLPEDLNPLINDPLSKYEKE